jgi:hypothetical protein
VADTAQSSDAIADSGGTATVSFAGSTSGCNGQTDQLVWGSAVLDNNVANTLKGDPG